MSIYVKDRDRALTHLYFYLFYIYAVQSTNEEKGHRATHQQNLTQEKMDMAKTGKLSERN